jgi:hydrogenase nickel incorporation protein HypA/HybF
MHELSIAVSLVDIASDEITRLGLVGVASVHVRVGALSGVVKDALLFSFEAAAEGTPLEGARLEIEEVPVTVWCVPCAAERTPASIASRRCPVCDIVTPDIVHGEELELIGLEVLDA